MGIIAFTFNAVAPLFLLAGLGILLRRFGYLDDGMAGRLNRICFAVLIPCLIFRTIYRAKFQLSSFYLIGYLLIAYFVLIVFLCVIVPRFFPQKRQAGVIVQSLFRTNMTMLGLPLVASLLGEAHTAPMALVIAVLSPCYSVAGVIVLTLFSEREGNVSPASMAKEILRNPLVIAAILGLAFHALQIPLPTIASKPIDDLAAMASPLAMIAMGARFDLQDFSDNRAAITFTTAGRLLVIPAAMVFVGLLLGFRGDELCALFIATGTPASAAGVAVADAMGSDGKLAGDILLTTTACSCLTLFAGLCVLQAAGWM